MLPAAFYLGGDFNEKRSIIYDFGGFYNSNSAALLLLQRDDGHFFLRGSAELQMLPGIFIRNFYICQFEFYVPTIMEKNHASSQNVLPYNF